MLARPELVSQDTDFSCAAACLCMLLRAHGIELSLNDARDRVDCHWDGTRPQALAMAARSLGLAGSRRYTLDSQELRAIVEEERYPIAMVKRRTVGAKRVLHAVVVDRISDTAVALLDPAPGKGEWDQPIGEFMQEWHWAGQEVTLVLREPYS